MPDKRSPAEARAEGLKANLIVRTNTAGKPIWLATWRDARRKSIMRTVGPAWLVPLPKHKNVYIEQDESRQRAKHATEAWRKSWKVRGQGRDEKPVKLAAGALDYREALKAADKLIVAREEERDDLHASMARAVNGDPRSFAALVDRWLDEKRAEVKDGLLRPSTMYVYAAMLAQPSEPKGARRAPNARVMRSFGDHAPRKITEEEINAFLKRLRDQDKLSARTVQKYTVLLGMVFAYGVDEGWLDTNPMANRKRAKNGKRQRKSLTIYTLEQVEAIARELGGRDGEIVRLAAYTGLRQGELLALRWANVEWTGGMIRVEASWDHRTGTEGPPKSGQDRVVPMGDPAAEVLERCSRTAEKTGARDLVFPGKRSKHVDGSAFYRRYCAARDAVRELERDCPALTFHALRHTFGSRLAAGGIPIVAIQSYMGHADIQTTSIYLHHVSRTGAAAEVTAALRRGASVDIVEETQAVAS